MPFDIPAIARRLGVAKALAPSDVHVDRPLTTMSVSFLQTDANFVADRIFPRVPVAKQSDQYWIHDREAYLRPAMKPRPPSTETTGVHMTYSTDTYFTDVYGLHVDVDERTEANADNPLDVASESVALLTRQGQLFREIVWASKYYKTGVWGTTETGVAAAPTAGQFLHWNDGASDPIKDIKRWKSSVHIVSGGFAPNVAVMSRAVYDTLTEHPSILYRINAGQTPGGPAMVTRATLAALMEVERIEVMDAVYNSAPEGQAESLEYIGGRTNFGLFYTPPSVGLRTPCAGATFVWNGYVGSADGQRVSTMPMATLKSTRYELESAFDHKVIGASMGFFTATAIA